MSKYYIDLDEILSFISDKTENEKNINAVTTVTYPLSEDSDDEIIELGHREISEQKFNYNEAASGIRFDLIRMLLSQIVESNIIDNLSEMTFTQDTIFNTFVKKGFIKKL